MDELIKVYEEYIELLNKSLTQSAGFLYVHNWQYAQEDIDKGVELREKIQNLKNKLNGTEIS